MDGERGGQPPLRTRVVRRELGVGERARALEAGATARERREASRAEFVRLTAPAHAEGAPPPPRVAILVAHGMGQQVKFETLELLVNALQREASRDGGPAPAVDVQQVPFDSDFFPRAEMTLARGGVRREVHLYEAYWAPLTEGRITTPETFWFLLQAGLLGLRRAWHLGMKRLMFDEWQQYRVPLRTALAFALAIAALCGLFVLNAVVLAAAASRGITSPVGHWPVGTLLADLTVDFLLVVAASIALLGAGLLLPRLLRRFRHPGDRHASPPAWVSRCGNFLMVVLAVVFVAAGALAAYHLVRHASPDIRPMWGHAGFDWLVTPLAATPAHSPRGAIQLLTFGLWTLVALIGLRARHFLLQFVGDVAIYVSAFTVNRFYEARHAIHDAVDRVARCVYGLRDAAGAPAYDRVIVVGHSLGSVIAYDALNRVIREDPAPLAPDGPVARTSALITFGSPLDKTAFIFRTQQSEKSVVREALAESVQPLIHSFRYRPPRWINLWSPYDWISGCLRFYDPVAEDGKPVQDPKCVCNLADVQASTPLQAHVEYWDGALLAETLWGEVMR